MGYQYDSETGLYYLNSRMYDPKVARFLQEDDPSYSDPNDPLSLNLYTYSLNNPLIYDDPTGHTSMSVNDALHIGSTAKTLQKYLNQYLPDEARTAINNEINTANQVLSDVVAGSSKPTNNVSAISTLVSLTKTVKKAGTITSIDKAYNSMTKYIDGKKVSKILLNEAIDYAAHYGSQTSVGSLESLNGKGKDYDRFDNQILAWTNYWNKVHGLGVSGKTPINANVIKAMMYNESNMGYDPSGKKNVSKDVMQCLFPGDPSFWEQAKIDYTPYIHKRGGVPLTYVKKDGVLVEASAPLGKYDPNEGVGKYGLPKSGYGLLKKIMVNAVDPTTGKNILVEDYSKVTPTMSIAFGVNWYAYQLQTSSTESAAVSAYNGGGSAKYGRSYLDDVNKTLKIMGCKPTAK